MMPRLHLHWSQWTAALLWGVVNASLVYSQADPDLYAYEGFDYDADSRLEFQDGGQGWQGAWTWRNAIDGKGGVVLNAAIVKAGSLSHGELATTGNHVHLYGDLGKLELGRLLANVIPGEDGTSTYLSFIGQRIGPIVDVNTENPHWDDPETPEVEPYPFNGNLYPRGAAPVRLWNDINRESLAVGNFFQRQTDTWMAYGGGLLHKTEISFSEAPSFVVVRLVHHGDDDPSDPDNNTADDLYMWINPPAGGPEDTSTADLTILAARDINDESNVVDFSDLSWISPFADNPDGDYPHAEVLLDEIRLGRTWESVTPVGEMGQPMRIIELSGDLDFGEIALNTSATATLTISNSGDSDLTVGNITYPDGFSGDWSTGVVAAGGSQEVTVSFSPVAAQAYSGEVVVESDATGGTGTITASGTGTEVITEPEWAGFPYDQNGDCNTGDFLGWINVTDAPLILSYALETYFYMEEEFVSANAGSWGFLYNLSSDAPKGGDSTWAGYTVLASQDVETRRFLGWINVIQAPYVYSYSFAYWVYMPEEFVSTAGSWGYFFDRG